MQKVLVICQLLLITNTYTYSQVATYHKQTASYVQMLVVRISGFNFVWPCVIFLFV